MTIKHVELTTLPAVKCPIDDEVRAAKYCLTCDAYKGRKEKDGKPTHIKCAEDEL